MSRRLLDSAMRVISLNIGRPIVLVRHGRQYSTAMNRKPVEGPLLLTQSGFEGDRVSDERVHGGPDRAACCYPLEHYKHMGERLGKELSPPAFGENLTTEGLLESEVCIGDVFEIGSAIVQVTSPRRPCAKLALKHDQPELPVWIQQSGFCGFYVRALQEGAIGSGDAIRLVERPHPDLSIHLAMQAMLKPDEHQAVVAHMASLAEASASWRAQMAGQLANPSE